MSNIEDLASSILSSRRNPVKEELISFVRECLTQIAEISSKYKAYFEGDESNPALLSDVEEKVQQIISEYEKVFPAEAGGTSKVSELESKFNEVKAYHEELLIGTGDEDSIKADIDDSHTKITDFYNELFDSEVGQNKAKHIRSFYDELTSAEGIEAETNRISKEIVDKHTELFKQDAKTNKSLVDDLEDGISKVDKYKTYIDEELQPYIDEKKKTINEVDKDIKIRQTEIGALLSDATAKTLAQGFLESKLEYANGTSKKYIKLNKLRSKSQWPHIFSNIGILVNNASVFLFYNNFGRYLPSALNYILFIAPLVGITFVFTNEEFTKVILSGLASGTLNDTNRLEVLYAKTIVSLPMIWIAWYGQRNISQRKRLREEYNHKYRVVQMYLHFLDGSATYKLSPDGRKALEAILLATVNDNPAQHLGKNETYVDDIKDKILNTIPFLGKSEKDKNKISPSAQEPMIS